MFHRADGQAAVYNQPTGEDEKFSAFQAAVACPTGSIRTEHRTDLSRTASDSFPVAATDNEGKALQGVYFNGFSSPHTFGALSWLILDAPVNIMVDCPRYSESLAKRILRMAQPDGVSFIMLTHRDDVFDNHRWAKRLGARRIIHASECSVSQHTADCEVQLDDDNFPYQIDKSFRIVHVPGHTRGSIALLHMPSQSLFSGDHIFGSNNGILTASTRYCSYSWTTLCDSVEALKEHPFIHLWPGHGRPYHFEDGNDRETCLTETANRLRALG